MTSPSFWCGYLYQGTPELLLSYNSMCSAVTGYSPHFLLFGRRPRIPVDYQFPTIRDPPHKAKLEESVADLQKRLKEALKWQGTSPVRKLSNNSTITTAKLELLLCNLEMLSWYKPKGLWANVRLKTDGKKEGLWLLNS